MSNAEYEKEKKKTQAVNRLRELLALQEKVEEQFGETGYNIFIFGSYLTTRYQKEISDIDIAIYADEFDLYKQLSSYLEEYFQQRGIPSDIFYIDTNMAAPIYCAPLKSKVQLTDYYPPKLIEFRKRCQKKLEENKARLRHEI